jgi:hypothetical protein
MLTGERGRQEKGMSTDTPKQKTRRTAGKPIPPGAYGNVQLSLFQNLLCNSEDERADLSNAIDLWDSIPRFAVSRQAMGKMRTAGGFLEVLEMPFHHRGVPLTAMIHPARIKQAHGKSLDFYPSAGEELLEQTLRKIAVEQFAGFFDKPDFRSGVRFTLHMLDPIKKYKNPCISWRIASSKSTGRMRKSKCSRQVPICHSWPA